MSSVSIDRMSGLDSTTGRSGGLSLSNSGVSMTPGHTALTRTPWLAASARSPMLSPTMACLVVEYGTSRGLGNRPEREAVLTMWPRPRSIIPG